MSRKRTARPAVLPGNPADPTGVDSLERRAIKDFDHRYRLIAKAYRDALSAIPARPVVNRRYEFELDSYSFRSVLDRLAVEVESILLEGGKDRVWIFEQYVSVSAIRGTNQAFTNLVLQSPVYRAARASLAEILQSEPHRRRMAILAAREYEEMEGIVGATKANMTRVLVEGIARGQNPREIAKSLTNQAGIEARRAHKVARTEITSALRRAKWDEADDAQALYGIETKELHLSALSPTTRAHHAARHAMLFAREQVRDWWSVDGNSINCKCSTSSVMVDSDGNPIVPSVIERARKSKRNMEARGYAWAKQQQQTEGKA